MKRILITLAFFATALSLAQQEPQFTMFWNNYSMFNPANTGLHYKHYGNVVYRAQWDKVENAPNSFTGLYEAKLDSINSGVGIGYFRDVIGLGSSDRFYLNYAYHLQMESSVLSFGAGAVINTRVFNPQWNPPQTPIDPSLPSGGHDTKLNLNFGVTYTREKLEVGLSSTQINQPFYEDINFQSARHYFGMVCYNFKLSQNFDLKPSLFIKGVSSFYSLDLNALLIFKNQYWLGGTYRAQDAIGVMGGVEIKEKFRLGYSYDFITNTVLSQYASGSHEIVLGILIK